MWQLERSGGITSFGPEPASHDKKNSSQIVPDPYRLCHDAMLCIQSDRRSLHAQHWQQNNFIDFSFMYTAVGSNGALEGLFPLHLYLVRTYQRTDHCGNVAVTHALL